MASGKKKRGKHRLPLSIKIYGSLASFSPYTSTGSWRMEARTFSIFTFSPFAIAVPSL